MSRAIRSYLTSSFYMIIRVTTVINHIHIPEAAIPSLEAAAVKLCKTRGFRFMGLRISTPNKIQFDIEITPKAGDLGAFVGIIKSVWSRLLIREFGVPSAAWVPRYLVMTITPPDAEAIEQEWIEKVSKAFPDESEGSEEEEEGSANV